MHAWPFMRKQVGQVLKIIMPERQDPRAREPGTGVHAGVGKLVDQDQIASACKRTGQTDIGEIAAAKDQRCRFSLAACQTRLDLLQQWMVPAHQPRGPGPCPVARDGRGRRSFDPGIMRKTEVIIA